MDEQSFAVEVALLASDSQEGELCARVIAGALAGADEPWSRYQGFGGDPVHRIPGLRIDRRADDTAPGGVFGEEGVPALLEKCFELVRGAKKAGVGPLRVLLNLTGGFKGTIPFTTLAGYFLPEADEVRLHYLFESSDEILELPLYPIGLDFPLWRRQSRLLDLADEHDAGDPYRKALHPRMESARGAGEEGLGPVLRRAYEDQLRTSPLQHQAKEVVGQLFPKRGALATRLENLIGVGDRIWIGDKLPMAADHAAKHHNDLLEITLCLLAPLLDQKTPSGGEFLNPAERFVLVSAVLLHDSGHTLDTLPLLDTPTNGLPEHCGDGTAPRVPLLRSEIRELHHFLAFHRVMAAGGDFAGVFDPTAEHSLAVATLCLYHRKRTGWKSEETKAGKGFCPYWRVQLPAASGVCFTGIDFPKLVALLRLIDGCDNQLGRVGDAEEAKLALQIFERDRTTWIERLRAAAGIARACWPASGGADASLDALANGDRDVAQKLLEEVEQNLASNSDLPKIAEAHWEVRRQLGAAITKGNATPAAKAWVEMLRALDEVAIRNRQQVHFWKHECVADVRVRTEVAADKVAIHVELVAEESSMGLLINEEEVEEYRGEMDGCTTLKAWIEGDLVAETQPWKGNGPLGCLAEKWGREVEVVFKWRHEEAAFATYPPTEQN
ncbi:MAG: hypothetical protein M5U13_15750 [Thermoanaerobaculia bacterium]|nr:hypothetical protein [Thermoanaerobaculia bacterium]